MSKFDIRKFLVPLLGIVAVGNVVLFVAMGIKGFLWRILHDRRIVTPALLFAISGGGIGVFALLFIQQEIHEDVLWVRTIELVIPLLTAAYAVWSLCLEIRRVK
ncbi:MAG: hypothetical protein V1724_04410 [Chloroflexota bacterium]